MFLPVGDTPNPEDYIPWGTWLLIGINIAVYLFVTYPLGHQPVTPYDPGLREYLRFLSPHLPARISLRQLLLQLNAYDLYVFNHGYKPGAPELSDLLYSLFLHAGFMHLFGNMLFLWIYGDNVEHRLGHLPYIFLYLACGISATLFFALFSSASMTPLIGASGAISGVLGFYFIFFPRNRIKVFIFFFPFIMNVFLLPSRLVLGFYLLVDNLLPFIFSSGSGGVAHGAHIGGFLAGLTCAWGYNLFQQRPDFEFSHSQTKNTTHDSASPNLEAPFQTLIRALASGQRELALTNLAKIRPEQLLTLDSQQIITLADWLRESGHHRSADHLLRSYIRNHPGSPILADVFLNLGRARIAENQAPSAYNYLLEGLDHHPSNETAAALRRELDRVDSYWKK